MNQPVISAVIPIRNRAGLRLQNCLASLRAQDGLSTESIEIVLSDFGSTAEHAAEIRQLADGFEATVVRTETDAPWNRSAALNRGIGSLRAPVTFCTDADMIFAPNFIAVLLSSLEAEAGRGMAVCRCLDLPDIGPERRFTADEFEQLRAQATMRPSSGTGACQAARTDWFKKVGGYDERFVFWGFEDGDMFFRAQKDGLTPCWLHDRTAMLHQYHPNIRNDRIFLKWKNKLRYYLTRGRVVKPSPLGPR